MTHGTLAPASKAGATQLIFLAILLAVFVAIAAQFAPFLSAYGDVQVYIRTEVFDLQNYQPVWPYIATLVYKAGGLDGLFYFQAALYFCSILLLYRAAESIKKGTGTIVAIFCVLNIRAYFYAANPLTETFNAFLFALGLLLWIKLPGKSALLRMALFALLVIMGFSRTTNAIFLGLLLLLSALQTIRKDRSLLVTQIAIILPATLIVALFVASVQSHSNNTGINLLRFVLSACEPNRCAPEVFISPAAPHIATYHQAHHSLQGVEGFLATENVGLYSPQLATEMKAIYLNLLFKDPLHFVTQVLVNYKQHATDTFLPPYPEDTNISVLDHGAIALANSISTYASRFIAAAAPLMAIWYLISIVLVRPVDRSISYLVAWLLAEIATSQILFSNLWVSDASRMRFHYEIPGLLLLLLFATQWQRKRIDGAVPARSTAATSL